jgi:hypothetical protein
MFLTVLLFHALIDSQSRRRVTGFLVLVAEPSFPGYERLILFDEAQLKNLK